MSRIAQFKKVQEESLKLFMQKNKDYGDSFAAHGTIGVLIRMNDKIKRAISVTNNSIAMTKSESLRDTLIDLHNYAGMAVMLIDEGQHGLSHVSIPPPPRYEWTPTPPSGANLPPPPPRFGAIPPPPAPRYSNNRKKYNWKNCSKCSNKNDYYVGQVVEIWSDHKKPDNVYKATIKLIPHESKMKLELEDGKTLYLNHWALKLKQSRAMRFKEENKSPMEKKWYLT